MPSVGYPISYREPYTNYDISHTVLLSFIAVVGTIGNGLVIKSFLGNRDQPGSRFVIALAVIDFVSSVVFPLINLIQIVYGISNHWPIGHVMCLSIEPWTTSLLFSSSWLLIAISLERMR